MKNTTKIIFGGFAVAMVAFGGLLFSKKAFAAKKIDVDNVNFFINQAINKSQNDTPSVTVNPDGVLEQFHALFVLDGKGLVIDDGDYFEVETHGLPLISKNQEIYSSRDEDRQEPIGNIECTMNYGSGSLAEKYSSNDPNFKALKPEDSSMQKCKITFNKHAQKHLNKYATLTLAFQNYNAKIDNPVAYANRNYTIKSWVKVNGGAQKDVANITVSKDLLDTRNIFNIYMSTFDVKNKELNLCPVVNLSDPGAYNTFVGWMDVTITLPANSPFKFKDDNVGGSVDGILMPVRGSRTSDYGVIGGVSSGEFSYRIGRITDKTITLHINGASGPFYSKLNCLKLKLSEDYNGKVDDYGNPEGYDNSYGTKTPILDDEGEMIGIVTTRQLYNPIVANIPIFDESIVVNPQDKSEENTQTPPKDDFKNDKTIPNQSAAELKSPDTGSKSNDLMPIFAISSIVTLIGSVIFFKKK